VGDEFLVRPGEKIDTDGVVREGSSAVDASILASESLPRPVGVGHPVAGGSLHLDGAPGGGRHRVGTDTLLARITVTMRVAPEVRPRSRGWPTGSPPGSCPW
jgi:Cu+-exporting ATPase